MRLLTCPLSLRLAVVAAVSVASPAAFAGLDVEKLGKTYNPDNSVTPIQQLQGSNGGNTSVRNNTVETLVWKGGDSNGEGYFQRNRDLGQVFTVGNTGFWLDSIILQTGPADAAVLVNTPGAAVFLQLFDISGTPTINDNGTPQGTNATHGFTTNHRADDYVEGITFSSKRVITGGTFPDIPPTRDENRDPLGNEGKKVFMRWDLTGLDELYLEPNTRYAFMVGLEQPGEHNGFTLNNRNRASDPAAPTLDDNVYAGGFALRREGDGTLPPTIIPGENPPADDDLRQQLINESMFPTGDGRYLDVMPTTNGFPDVDTYRDLTFAIEVHWENPIPEPATLPLLAVVLSGAMLRRRSR